MDNTKNKSGSVQEFDSNWSQRKEASYNHWIKSNPQNQIQLAFRSHWLLFQEMMQGINYQSCLEVGCGRGSISSYFAENGFDSTLLDSSVSVLDTARKIFASNGHQAKFVHGDALDMPFENNSFDVVVSIGLLEHFQDIQKPIHEQFRVLRPGGMFLGYIVPENPDNIQCYFNWLNKVLSIIAGLLKRGNEAAAQKTDIYRSDYGSERYLPIFRSLPVKKVLVSGVYPLPMISHSPEFPFSLLPSLAEKMLTEVFELILFIRRTLYQKNPWLCGENWGQAFLIAFIKEV